MRLGTMEMRPCGVKRLGNIFLPFKSGADASGHNGDVPVRRQTPWQYVYYCLRRFPCTNSSHCTELASSPLFHGIALFLCLCLPTEAHTHGGVFLARTHSIAPSSHLHRSFMALRFSLPLLAYGGSHPWRRFPCASTSARAPSASPPLIRNFLFATLFPAAFSLHELIPLHRARIFTVLSWHCSFNNLFLSAAWFACGHSHSMVAGGFPVMS